MKLAGFTLGALLVGSATTVHADFAADEFPPYERCALCHGLFGVSHHFKFPHLGGQDPVYIERQIRAFLDGVRDNDGGQMSAIVTELKPEEIPVAVAWFAEQEPPAPEAYDGMAAGAALYEERGCGGCHDAAGEGVPHLTAQHAGYLQKQMADFREGRRSSAHLGVPHGDMMPGADDEIAAIAAYLAGTPRQ